MQPAPVQRCHVNEAPYDFHRADPSSDNPLLCSKCKTPILRLTTPTRAARFPPISTTLDRRKSCLCPGEVPDVTGAQGVLELQRTYCMKGGFKSAISLSPSKRLLAQRETPEAWGSEIQSGFASASRKEMVPDGISCALHVTVAIVAQATIAKHLRFKVFLPQIVRTSNASDTSSESNC